MANLNPKELSAFLERIANGEEGEADIPNFIEILTKLEVDKDNIQALLRIFRESKQKITQIVVQLGKYNFNMGEANNNQMGDIYQGINTETIKAAIQEVLQETIQGISIKKIAQVNAQISRPSNYSPQTTSKSFLETSYLGTQVFLPPPPPPAISTFEFELVTVDVQGKIIKRHSKQAQYFVENLGDGVALEMVSIGGGTFQMGAPQNEFGTIEDERPQHLVTLKDFSVGRYPITQAQWRVVANFPKIQHDLDPNPSYFKKDNLPVECVSWYEAGEFCARLLQKTRRVYRLPSEAEWEYACRAQTSSSFHFGATITTDLANYCGQEQQFNGVYRKRTTEVGIFPANAFGLHDMHGNVWEWCADYQHEDYYDAPSDGSVWMKDGNSEYRILRGGSWDYSPSYCRCASRFFDNPSYKNKEFGFRVVCCL